MSDKQTAPDKKTAPDLNAREFLRWIWRQLTSMRTALLLLLLLAVGAVPGSVIPQTNIDAMKVTRWKDAHPKLTPVYEKLGLFDVYASPWFAAIYILLMISLIGCILPRLGVYWRALRAQPPAAPRNLTRLPESAAYTTEASVETVLAAAQQTLRKRRFRLADSQDSDWVGGERGYLREAGNLLFHFSVLVVLVGFGVGNLFGYQGGVITLVGHGFANNLTQYDDFAPGALFDVNDLDRFRFNIDDFDVEWIYKGQGAGSARKFVSHLTYTEDNGPEQKYDLRVNHPLSIGGTDVFLIGHGYAPVFEVKDGKGNVYELPTIFLPQDKTLVSYGVVKVPFAEPEQLAFDGQLYPTFGFTMARGPFSTFGEALDPLVSMSAYTGDLGMTDGKPQSVYVLKRDNIKPLMKADGKPVRLDLRLGESAKLPNGLGTVTFKKLEVWNKIQIARTPFKWVTLLGVLMALLGLLGSLFIRPRRIWVRARRTEQGTLVEIGGIDRSGNGDVTSEIELIQTQLEQAAGDKKA